MTARVDRNIVRWLESVPQPDESIGKKDRLPAGLTIGIQPSLDPDELRVHATGNRVEVPLISKFGPILSVSSATFNSRRIVDGKFRMTGDPTLVRGSAGSNNANRSR